MKKVPTFVTTGPSDRANVTKIIIIIIIMQGGELNPGPRSYHKRYL